MSRINVAHNAVNLAGPIADRPNYLKTVIANHSIMPTGEGMSDLLKRSYSKGPNSQLKTMYRWSRDSENTGYFGRTQGIYDIGIPDDLDHPNMKRHLILSDSDMEYIFNNAGFSFESPVTADNLRAQSSMICRLAVGPCMYSYWARQRWFNDHFEHVSAMSKPWESSYNSSTGQITLHMPGRYTDVFTPSDFDLNANYLYMDLRYNLFDRKVIYRIGSGNTTFDAIAANVEALDHGFYPVIPIRVNNMMISSSCPEGFEQTEKALKKSFGMDIMEIQDKLEENSELGDIDDVYMLYAVQANSQDRSCLKYIFEFFRMMARDHWPTSGERTTYTSAMDTYYTEFAAYLTWSNAGGIGSPPSVSTPPTTGKGQLNIQAYSGLPGGWTADFTAAIRWGALKEEHGTGLKKVGAQVGELWWEVSGGVATLCWQYQANWWKAFVVTNAYFINWADSQIDKSLVSICLTTDDTVFVFPLNTKVMTNIGVVAAAQVSTQCAILQSSAWKVITPGILGVIIFFVAFLLMIIFPPLNIGILGSGLAVGTSLGFVGIGAAIIGAIVNTIVAMIVMKVIAKISVLVFGEKIGAIIGAIVSFVAISIGPGLFNGQSLSSIMGSMLSVDKLLALTNAVGSGVAGYIAGAVREIQGDLEDLNKSYKSQMNTISDLYAQNIGSDMGMLDPLGLTDTNLGVWMETSDQFLQRTLMTGTDIAELSKDLLNNFASITTDTSLPLGQV